MAKNILHIDFSPRGAASHSRRISAELVETLKAANPEITITYRDAGREPLPHVTEAWTEGAYMPEGERTPAHIEALKLSDELVDELLAADTLVLGVPMYNLSVGSAFKAWVDQIVLINRTFTGYYKGLSGGRKVLFVTARGGGGYGPGEAMEAINQQDPYIKFIMGFIGITDVDFVHVNNTLKGGDAVQESTASARETIKQIGAAA